MTNRSLLTKAFITAFPIVFLTAPAAHAASGDAEPELIAVPAFIAEVKRELGAAQAVIWSELGLELKTVTLSLSIATLKAVDGKITLGIVPVSMTPLTGSRRIQKVSVNLQPPGPRSRRSGSEALFELDLASLIVDLARDLQKGLRDPPRLDSENLAMKILFGAEHSIVGGGINLVFLEFGTETDIQDESVQSLSLRFERLPAPK